MPLTTLYTAVQINQVRSETVKTEYISEVKIQQDVNTPWVLRANTCLPFSQKTKITKKDTYSFVRHAGSLAEVDNIISPPVVLFDHLEPLLPA